MKKFLAIALSVALAALALVGCGKPGEENKTYNLGDLVTAVEKANPVSNPRDINENDLTLTMLLTKDNILEYAGKISNDQGNSALILAIKAAEGKAGEVKTELNTYKTSISSGGMYAEFEAMETMAKDARIVEKGDYVVMVVANTQGADYAEIDKAIDEALS